MKKILFVLTYLVCVVAGPAYAADQETNQPVLTIQVEGGAAPVSINLSSLPQTVFETTTIWTTGMQEFTGVPLAVLLDTIGAKDGIARAVAANDYAVDIPIASITSTEPIVAWKIDGKPISRRTKGPLWIVFPYDSDAKFRTETVYSQSIWQLQSINVINQ